MLETREACEAPLAPLAYCVTEHHVPYITKVPATQGSKGKGLNKNGHLL